MSGYGHTGKEYRIRMGILQVFKRRKERKKRFDQAESNVTEFVSFIRDNMELYNESAKQIKEAKQEYQAISSYMTDMQKIEMVPKEHRENLDNAAQMIVKLTRQRLKHQKRKIHISEMQYQLFERYEDQIPKALISLKEEEDYKKDIEKDMAHLEDERQNLDSDKEEIVNQQGYLKGLGIATFVATVLLFGLLLFISSRRNVDLTLPFLLTVLMGMASTLYIFMESRKILKSIKLVNSKIRRQIYLMNKVKIKAVNNYNYLEYVYGKYMVDNYKQLKQFWDEYLSLKKDTNEYRNSTERLEHYSRELAYELERFGIKDTEIWIHQVKSILDSDEMEEIRNRVNDRRSQLRKQIETCQKQQEEAIDTITLIVKANPDKEEEAAKILTQYKNVLKQE